MANPGSLALLSMGSSAASGLLGAVGASKSAEAESQMYQYRAGMALANKRIAEQNADYSLKVGEQEAGRYGIKARQNMGAIRAAQSGSGLDVNSGSAALVQESAHEIAGMDMATIRQNAIRKAYGYQIEASQAEREAGLYGMASENAKSAGKINALSSLISGASSVSSKWMQAKQAGAL